MVKNFRVSQKWIVLGMLSVSMLTGCGSHQQNFDNIDTTNKIQLESIQVLPITSSGARTGIGQLRMKSLQDSAMSIGAQAGLASSSGKLNTQMNKDGKYLDSI